MTGRILTGIIEKGQVITFAPTYLTGTVNSIQAFQRTIEKGMPGDIVGLEVTIQNASKSEIKLIKRGIVISDAEKEPAMEVKEIVA